MNIATWRREARKESVNSMWPPSSVVVALCLHGAHILSGEVLSSLVWPDLFTLQARLQLSNTYQNIYSLLYLQTCITFSVLPHLYFLCLSLTVFIILTLRTFA